MASSIAAKKRIRQNEKRRIRNRGYRSALRTEIKKFNRLIESGDTDAAQQLMQSVARRLDKLVAKGVVHKNEAARRKSRMARKVQGEPANA